MESSAGILILITTEGETFSFGPMSDLLDPVTQLLTSQQNVTVTDTDLSKAVRGRQLGCSHEFSPVEGGVNDLFFDFLFLSQTFQLENSSPNLFSRREIFLISDFFTNNSWGIHFPAFSCPSIVLPFSALNRTQNFPREEIINPILPPNYVGIIIAAVVIPVLFLATIVVVVWWRRRKRNKNRDHRESAFELQRVTSSTPARSLLSSQASLSHSTSKNSIRQFIPAFFLNPKETNSSLPVEKNKMNFIPIEDIKLIDKIGQGNFGVVYRGLYGGGNVEVALKQIIVGENSNENSSMEKELKLWDDELSVICKLSHPNIVRLLGLYRIKDEENSEKFLVLEYCSGGALSEWLRETKIEEENVFFDIALQTCDGMKYLHSQNILHR
jgi:hypothetical protein